MINPIVAGNMEWFKCVLSSEGSKSEQADPEKVKKITKKTGKMTQSGLNKLHNWTQDQQHIYRGDTFSKEEGQKLTAGNKKTYPHFVSVSEKATIPRIFVDANRKKERPIGIVWHITKSEHGKNVASLSENAGEKEILFPPNTTFQIDKVISEKQDDKGTIKELEAHEA
jgi:hypothetical protein